MVASGPVGVLRRGRRSFLRYLADNNPFYLLSAASMLMACVLLSNTTSWSPVAPHKLLALIATLGVYELLLVGLGAWLIARRGHARDGVVLLVLEAFFLADVGFLASEAYQISLAAGLVVCGALLAVGAAKLVAIFRVLRVPVRSAVFGLTLATLAVLLLHPAALKYLSDHDRGRVPELALYAAWWALAGLVAGYGLLLGGRSPVLFRGRRTATAFAGYGHVLAVVLLVSLVAHLGTAHWVYKCPFRPADLSPVLAALAVPLVRVPRGAFYGRRDATALGALLCVAAVMTSLDTPAALSMHLGTAGVSPLMLAGAAAYLALLDVLARRRFVPLALAGVGAAVAYVLGPTWQSVMEAGDRVLVALVNAAGAVVDRLVPQTQAAWGLLALAGAFVLLGVGAAVSWWRPERRDDLAEPPATPAG